VLYALLVGSAALTFFGRHSPGLLPFVIERLTPWVFLGFVAAFAFYRLGLVRAGKYRAFKAFFQIALALTVFLLLMPGTQRPAAPVDSLAASLQDPNPRVRALAAELARYRPGGQKYGPLLVRRLEDSDGEVRAQAHLSLVQLSGADLGSPLDANAVRAWKERYP
jgi:hypothetical protein